MKKYIHLNEALRLSDLMKHAGLSDFTEPFMIERRKVKGGGNVSSELWKCEVDKANNWVTFTFRSAPTFPKPQPKKVVPSNNFKLTKTPVYIQEIRLLNFFDWLNVFEGEDITPSNMKEILNVSDIQYFCLCPSFFWQGGAWVASQFGASIHPVSIQPKEIKRDADGKITKFGWRTYQKDENATCKHLDLIFNSMSFFKNPMASMLNKALKKEGII